MSELQEQCKWVQVNGEVLAFDEAKLPKVFKHS